MVDVFNIFADAIVPVSLDTQLQVRVLVKGVKTFV